MAVAPKNHIDRPFLGRIPDVMELPDLIEIQTRSYGDFLQWDVPPDERESVGLQEVFLDVFPIASPDGLTRLEFVHYSFTPPKYTISGMPGARPDVRRLAEGVAATGAVRGSGRVQRTARALDGRAGGVPGRTAADDADGHVHHQRRRARDREPAAQVAGRVVRNQDPPERQIAAVGAHHPVPRRVARIRIRRQRHPVADHRPPVAHPGHDVPSRRSATKTTRKSSACSTGSRRPRSAAPRSRSAASPWRPQDLVGRYVGAT